MVGHKEKVYALNAAVQDEPEDYCKQPRSPDDVFDPVCFFIANFFIHNLKAAFLQAASRADSPAEGPPEKQRGNKLGGKQQQASGDNSGKTIYKAYLERADEAVAFINENIISEEDRKGVDYETPENS